MASDKQLNKSIYEAFMKSAAETGNFQKIEQYLEKTTDTAWTFIEEFGHQAEFMLDGKKVPVWKGITRQELKHAINRRMMMNAN